MSSILEALRELEGERPPATRREIPPSEPTSPTRRASGALIPLTGGLAIGILAFGVYAWGPSLLALRPASEPSPRPGSDTGMSARPADTATTERPAWLDTADAPRARVNRGATSAPAPERPAASTARDPAATAVPEPASEEARAEPRPSTSGGQVAVESIAYAANAAERTATMRFHGRRVTVRQRESIDGIEVQLIMPNGVYLQHGSEVYLLPLTR